MAIVIVGASLAGANAAETLRSEGYQKEIIMIGDEPDPPYERPPLSKGYLLGNQELDEAFVHPMEWYREHTIDLRLSTSVTALDVGDKRVRLSSGERIGYDKLLLATGARPRPVDVGGARYLRDIRDSKALKSLLTAGTDVAVIGAGWIGLEVTAAARTHGAEVSVVETDSLPLRRVLGDELAAFYRDVHADKGVAFHFGRTVTSSDGASVTLDDGTSVPADVVLAGVGVSPCTELAADAGLEVDNGIVVSESLQTSAPDVYACGDAANWFNPLIGARMRVEHWENARQGGMVAARAMLGQQVSYDWIPYFYSDQYDVGMEYSGWVGPGGYDRVVIRGSMDSREFIAFWVKDSRVLAGMNVNVWDVQDDIRALIKAGYADGATVDLAKLADGEAALDTSLIA
ncbi:NAD(P)/FAD-dependent oxidoreductase [Allorhizocola rhizosphaerae]|uniref:NAD(P)/FAD-dependent oxidoreductase n=1 Tax=Allorhizocola rhizosphaerae TaxID=1872709 RepID=UPI000E3DCB36|nr:FAD-dependent oxidoreductase [Allorhizocola rhizosphaerae]